VEMSMNCDIDGRQLAQDLMIHTFLAYYPTVYVGLFDKEKLLFHTRYTTTNINQSFDIGMRQISCAAYFSIAAKSPKPGTVLREIWRISVNRCEALCGVEFAAAEIDKKHVEQHYDESSDQSYNATAIDVEFGCHSEGLFICECRANHICHAPLGYYRQSKEQYIQLMTVHRMVCPERPKCLSYHAASECLKSLTK
jgi:hypothetical protein